MKNWAVFGMGLSMWACISTTEISHSSSSTNLAQSSVSSSSTPSLSVGEKISQSSMSSSSDPSLSVSEENWGMDGLEYTQMVVDSLRSFWKRKQLASSKEALDSLEADLNKLNGHFHLDSINLMKYCTKGESFLFLRLPSKTFGEWTAGLTHEGDTLYTYNMDRSSQRTDCNLSVRWGDSAIVKIWEIPLLHSIHYIRDGIDVQLQLAFLN